MLFFFVRKMDGLRISQSQRHKVSALIVKLNALANLDHPREAIAQIYLLKDALSLFERSLLVRDIGVSICDLFLDYYRNYPALW